MKSLKKLKKCFTPLSRDTSTVKNSFVIIHFKVVVRVNLALS